MKACPAKEEALALLKKYNSELFHIQHALTVEGVMRWYANELGYGEDADFWATVGLLHDVDFEKWPEQHCVKAPELLQEIGCSRDVINTGAERLGWPIEELMEKTILAMRSCEDAVNEAVSAL